MIFNNINDTEEAHKEGDPIVIEGGEGTVVEGDAIDVTKTNETTNYKVRVYDASGVYTAEQAEDILEKVYPITDYCEVLVYVASDLKKVTEEAFTKKCDAIYESDLNGLNAVIYMVDAKTKKDFIYTNNGSSSIAELEPPMDDVPASLKEENPYEYTLKIFETLMSAING